MTIAPPAYNYTVRGTGRFPIVVLAYANAWPATDVDAYLIEGTRRGRSSDPIRLRGLHPPERSPWADHGWTVVDD